MYSYMCWQFCCQSAQLAEVKSFRSIFCLLCPTTHVFLHLQQYGKTCDLLINLFKTKFWLYISKHSTQIMFTHCKCKKIVRVLFGLHQSNLEHNSSNILATYFACFFCFLARCIIVCLVNEVLVTEDLASFICCWRLFDVQGFEHCWIYCEALMDL